jgi:hypothetical protein
LQGAELSTPRAPLTPCRFLGDLAFAEGAAKDDASVAWLVSSAELQSSSLSSTALLVGWLVTLGDSHVGLPAKDGDLEQLPGPASGTPAAFSTLCPRSILFLAHV